MDLPPPALVSPAPGTDIAVATFRDSAVPVAFEWQPFGDATRCANGELPRERLQVGRQSGVGTVVTPAVLYAPDGLRRVTIGVPFDGGPQQTVEWKILRGCLDGQNTITSETGSFEMTFRGVVPPSRLITITGDGVAVAGVKVGTPIAQATRALGAKRGKGSTWVKVLPRREGSITMRSSGGNVALMEVRGFGFATAEGVHLGTPAADAQALTVGAQARTDVYGVLRGLCWIGGPHALQARTAVPAQTAPPELATWSVRATGAPGACG